MNNGMGPGRNEYQGTYVVLDRNSQEELHRLTIQDQLITTAMGGILPEQSDPTLFHRVLDVGCGTGGWIIEAAKTYPEMKLIGVDINKMRIEYARAQAEAQQVADRVEFHIMDALLILEFPPAFFDLVNVRFCTSFVRTWEWPRLLNELQRVARPGGVIRITEVDLTPPSNDPALAQLCEAWVCGFFRAGHLFEEQPDGLTAHLPELLTRHGVQQAQTKVHVLKFRAGTPEGQSYYEDMRRAFHTIRPFLARRGCSPKDYDALYQQALAEMQHADFCATSRLLTAWGNKL
jgi:ubiquinone/menaquinone biosynthesis C-methylase UbiE